MSDYADVDAVLEGGARWSLLHADCLDVLPALPDRSVAHVITDPPYEAEAHTLQRRTKVYDPRATGRRDGMVAVVAPLKFEPISDVDRRAAAVDIGRVAARWSLIFCQVEAAMKWRDATVGDEFGVNGVSYRRTCIWDKPDAMPQLTGDRPAMGYESIVACHAKGRSRWNGGGRRGVFRHMKQQPEPSQSPPEHPTTKPLPLMLELVELFTDPDDIVLDPFAGSGTTGVACLRLGRRFIGIEKDPTYAQLARDRLTAEERGSTLQAHRAGQEPLFKVGT